jgi:hypothetical protein
MSKVTASSPIGVAMVTSHDPAKVVNPSFSFSDGLSERMKSV